MKYFLFGALLLSSTMAFAGDIRVDCGELIKYKSTSKSVLKFPASILIPLRLPAIKVKLKNSSSFSRIYKGQTIVSSAERRKKIKLGYTDETNREKHLGLLKTAKEEMKLTKSPAYVCFGEVQGLDRWHKILSTSLESREKAFDELVRKYQ